MSMFQVASRHSTGLYQKGNMFCFAIKNIRGLSLNLPCTSRFVRSICSQNNIGKTDPCRKQKKPTNSGLKSTNVLHSYDSNVRRYSSESSDGFSSLNVDEASKFHLHNDWWSPRGSAAPLHTLNLLRVPFIRDGLVPIGDADEPRPLTGFNLLDVGSGGGILSEALGRLGATVTGIDPIEENVALATQHVQFDPDLASRVSYKCCTVEDIEDEEIYDGVICSEVLEHVNSQTDFIGTCASLVKPGGSIFFTTMNKTPLSWALAIVAAENIFRIVPQGTHDWEKFISPGEIQDTLLNYDMDTRLVHGMTLNPVTLRWCWIKDTRVNYALHAIKH